MSTPTPRTDRATYPGVIRNGTMREDAVYANFARKLETELAAALARIAELENERDFLSDQSSTKGLKIESLTRQLSESQDHIAVAEKRIFDRDTKITNLQAQLASAREDSARLDWLLEFITQNGANGIADMQWTIKDDEGEIVNDGDTIQEDRLEARFDRSAIDSARGVTSPPTASCSMCGESTPSADCPVCAQDQLVAETGEKDDWQPIETAPKDKKAFLTTHRLHGGFQQIGWWNGAHYTTASHQIPDDWVWTDLPPPPQGKENQ